MVLSCVKYLRKKGEDINFELFGCYGIRFWQNNILGSLQVYMLIIPI